MRITRRTITATALTATALIALTGCMKIDAALTISPDDTIDGTITAGVSKALLEQYDMTSEDVFGESPDGALLGATPKKWEDDEYIGYSFEVVDADLTDMTNAEGLSMDITHDEGTFTVDGTLGEDSEESDELPLLDGVSAGDLEVSITFPGEVVESNGVITGNTVTWTGSVSEALDIHAVAKDSDSSAPLLIAGIGAALVLAAVAGAVVVVLRRRGQAAPSVKDEDDVEGDGSADVEDELAPTGKDSLYWSGDPDEPYAS